MSRKRKDVQNELSKKLSDMRAIMGKPEEQEKLRTMQAEVESLTEELNRINIDEAAERAIANSMLSDDVKETARKFSFAKFFRELSSKEGLTGVELEMSQLAKQECERSGIALKGTGIPVCVLNYSRAFAGMTAGTQTDGGYTIATSLRYQEELRKRLVLASAGAQYVGGLTGNITIIDGKHITANWEGENTTASDVKKTFTTRELKPKRLAVNVPISKQLIIQSSWDVEQMIISDILNAHAEALETAAINGSGEGQPTGILNTSGIGSVVIGENGGAVTFGKMVDLETAISIRNADLGSLAYLTNSKVRGALKQTLRSQGGSGYIWENGEVNGYKAYASNIIPSDIKKGTGTNLNAALFANFNDLLICQWGGLDVISDPYTLKKEGAIEITMNAYHDVFVRRAESFAAIKDIAV
ncbi:phage major capsid protein [Parabacteroides sp. AM08-6]|uniref:phage major capsid protein n=1 Tax=Parabacteroides sp. AM08-6 TaxID=2292053 RepID=UPI001314A7C8|nr:phage major capsid protein [Parabacteroides sp. AM08-6]